MKDYKLEKTSVWRFPDRGSWATHKGDYRGNWSPHIPRNLILKYTNEFDTVLDCFVGSGTTMIECALLNRKGIGVDINEKALEITKNRIKNLNISTIDIKLIKSSATTLEQVPSNSVDLVCTHPPYANIIKYSDDLSDDLSLLCLEQFLTSLEIVMDEIRRVLKESGTCAIMIGDVRKGGKITPLGFELLRICQKLNFKLKDIIIKEQFNCKRTDYWLNKEVLDFYLLMHEYIFVFKP